MTNDVPGAPITRSRWRPAGLARVGWRALARAAWAALVLLALGMFVLAIPALHARRSAPSGLVAAGLAELGLSVHLYAAYWTGLHILFACVYFVSAATIVRRRWNDPMALFVSLFLVLFGGANAPLTGALVWRYPAMAAPAQMLFFLTAVSLILFFFVFPDGRLAPRWASMPLVAWGALVFVGLVVTGAAAEAAPRWPVLLLVLGGLGAGVAAQVYRYARVSGRVERQQTKWVVVGASAAAVGQLLGALVLRLDYLGQPASTAVLLDAAGVTVIVSGFLMIPLSIGIAVLRHRLWDVDVLIHRALVYGGLTGGVVAAYVLVVGALGALLHATGNSIVSLVAAGVVAVLFQPLRERLQRGVNRLLYGQRDEPYAVLSRLGRRLEATLAPEAVLPTIVATVREALKLPYAAIGLRREDGFGLAAASGRPVPDLVRLPLVYQGEPVGELLLGSRPGEEDFRPADRRLLEDVARAAGVAAHAVRLSADLRRSNEHLAAAREQLVTAREEERRRLRGDLHDGLGPQLAAFTLRLDAARNLLRRDPDATDALLGDLAERSQAAVADIRRLAYALRPPALDEFGLVGALRQHAAQYVDAGLRVAVEAPECLPALPAAVEVAAYRIGTEALANVARHAGARGCRIGVALDRRASRLRLDVADDGRGLSPDQPTGVGLVSMRERAEELGGTCVVDSAPGRGTIVRAVLPLAGPAPEA